MQYQFRDVQSGEPVTLDLPMATAPSIGSMVFRNGRTLIRVPTAPNMAIEPEAGPSIQHRPWAPGFTDYAKDGSPVPRNRREQREAAKRNGLTPLD